MTLCDIEGAGRGICKCYHWLIIPFNSNGKQRLFNSATRPKRGRKEREKMSVLYRWEMQLHLTFLHIWKQTGMPNRCTAKLCSQCQNRGQVEVYGGGWILLDWLCNGGGDAETGGLGGCCMLKPAGPAGGHIGDQSAPLQRCHCRVWSCLRIPPITPHKYTQILLALIPV